jgi:putative ABC transport system permease protein
VLTLALRNVFRHRARSALTLAAIAFGVAGLILSAGFVRDIIAQLGEALIHSQSGHLQVMREGYFEAGSRSPERFALPDPGRVRRIASSVPGVQSVMARVAFQGLLNNGRADRPVVGEGVEAGAEARLGSFVRVVAGRALRDGDQDAIVLGEGLAQALGVHPGASVTLLANTAEGALNTRELEVVGVFQSFSRDFDAHAVRLPLAAAQELLDAPLVTTVVVLLQSTEDTETAAAALRQRLAGTGLEVKTWQDLNDFYGKAVALYRQQFGVLRWIVLAMVLLSVANSVNMTLFERLGEFGTMQALGNRRGHVFRLVLVESAILGVTGAIAGAALGWAAEAGLSAIGIPMPPPPNSDFAYVARIRISATDVATAMAVGFAATLLAAVFPALRVSRTPVVDALRANV